MKTKRFISLTVCSLLIVGCVPFASNEFNTRLWMSKEKRIKTFQETNNSFIGKQFYSHSSKKELCKTTKCNDISNNITEYIVEYFSNTNPQRKCVFAWIVDASLKEVNVPHWRGISLGKKIGWRYLSEPDQCLSGINFSGPW